MTKHKFIAWIFLFFGSSPLIYSQSSKNFTYPKGKLAQVFALENEDPEESFLLAFRFFNYLDLVFLNESMEYQRKLEISSFPKQREGGLAVQAISNSSKKLNLIVADGLWVNEYESLLFCIDKQSGEYESRRLSLSEEKIDELEKADVRLLKIFQSKDRFYKLWIDEQASLLHILYFDLTEIEKGIPQLTSIDISETGLAKKLGISDDYSIPLISNKSDASIAGNASPEKIYHLAQNILISFEEEDQTKFLIIDTENWELSTKLFPFPDFDENQEKIRLNSYLYEKDLYQVSFDERGVHLSIADFGSGKLLYSRRWEAEDKFLEDFPVHKKINYNSKRLLIKDADNMWYRFSKGISVLVETDGKTERLSIGSHNIIPRKSKNLLGATMAIGTFGGAIGASSLGSAGGSPSVLGGYPFSTNQLTKAVYYFGEGLIYRADTNWDAENFELSSTNVSLAPFDRMMKEIDKIQQEKNIYSMSLFEKNDKSYFGYWWKKQYHILDF
ncbi:MAG: hypothetical protein AAF696_24175 [Bacteroidota bacterium]